MKQEVDQAAVAVRLESTLNLELFSPEATELDDTGVANNLVPGSEYVVFTRRELVDYTVGNFSIRAGSIDDEPSKFKIIFPSLNSMKKSITATRKTD